MTPWERMESMRAGKMDSKTRERRGWRAYDRQREEAVEAARKAIADAVVPEVQTDEKIEEVKAAPQEIVNAPAQIIDVPVPQNVEEHTAKRGIEEEVKVPQCAAQEQIVDVPAPQTKTVYQEKAVKEVVQAPEEERVMDCTVEMVPNVPVPQTVEEMVNVPKVFSQDEAAPQEIVDAPESAQQQEPSLNGITEQIIDVPVPQTVEEQTAVSDVEGIVDVTGQQTVEEEVKVVNIVPQEEIVNVPVAQTGEETVNVTKTVGEEWTWLFKFCCLRR